MHDVSPPIHRYAMWWEKPGNQIRKLRLEEW